jgi:hypothetical protein
MRLVRASERVCRLNLCTVLVFSMLLYIYQPRYLYSILERGKVKLNWSTKNEQAYFLFLFVTASIILPPFINYRF